MQGAERQGPVGLDIIKARLQNKVLKDSTLVWNESFGDEWMRLDEVLAEIAGERTKQESNHTVDAGRSAEGWYYIEKGERKGPISQKSLQAKFEEGALDENTRVWTERFGDDWKAISQVSDLRAAGQPPIVPASEIQNLWLYLLISVPLVMAVVEEIWLEPSATLSADGAAVIGFLLFFIPNTVCALLDQKAVERSSRKDVVKGLLFWIIIFVPLYIFLRSKRTGLGFWPGFAWIGTLIAGVFVSDVLPRNIYLGAGVPSCESRTTIGMIEEIYPTIPINFVRSTVIRISNMEEISFLSENRVRECSGVVRNSSGLDTPIYYTITDRGDEFYYEVRFSGF